MYPLNMHNPDAGGYAVANDADEHKALTDAGYLPPLDEATEVKAENESEQGSVALAEPVKRGPGRPRKADA